MDFGWHAFFKKPACSFHFRVPPFRNSFVIPPGGFSDNHGHEVIQHGPLLFGRENNGIKAVSAAAAAIFSECIIYRQSCNWMKNKTFMECRKNHHLSSGSSFE